MCHACGTARDADDGWTAVRARNCTVALCPECWADLDQTPYMYINRSLAKCCVDGCYQDYGRTEMRMYLSRRGHVRAAFALCEGGLHPLCRRCARHPESRTPDGCLYCDGCIIPALRERLEHHVRYVPGLREADTAARLLLGRRGLRYLARGVVAKLLG